MDLKKRKKHEGGLNIRISFVICTIQLRKSGVGILQTVTTENTEVKTSTDKC
jgi:hypothetical protein